MYMTDTILSHLIRFLPFLRPILIKLIIKTRKNNGIPIKYKSKNSCPVCLYEIQNSHSYNEEDEEDSLFETNQENIRKYNKQIECICPMCGKKIILTK